MQTFIPSAPRRILGVALGALFMSAAAGISVPSAFADSSPATAATVLVPRMTKGAYGGLVRVKSTSPEARAYAASLARSQAPRSANCPSTVCVRTTTCYDVKGALGARCISQ